MGRRATKSGRLVRRTGLERMIVDPRAWVREEAQRALAALERKG